MPRPYRAPNKRLQFRADGGQFRRATLADVGAGVCDKCGRFFVPNLAGMEGPFVDPRDFNSRRRTCGSCLGLPEPEPRPAPPSLMEKMAEWMGEPGP